MSTDLSDAGGVPQDQPITRREYLAWHAVDAYARLQPHIDMHERKTWAEWEQP